MISIIFRRTAHSGSNGPHGQPAVSLAEEALERGIEIVATAIPVSLDVKVAGVSKMSAIQE